MTEPKGAGVARRTRVWQGEYHRLDGTVIARYALQWLKSNGVLVALVRPDHYGMARRATVPH
jgi:hypothetical protein